MIYLSYSDTDRSSIASNLGLPEYSYYFVQKEFRSLLEEGSIVFPMTNPDSEADLVWKNIHSRGEECVLLSFAPPHKTFVPLLCPFIPIFAWEFDTIPNEIWDNDPKQDWRYVLSLAGRAITHSNHTVRTVRTAMGDDYPVIALPSPVWDSFAPYFTGRRYGSGSTLTVRGRIFDSRKIDLAIYSSVRRREQGRAPLPADAGDRNTDRELALDGVIYTSVLCPTDGRKNWFDMIGAFCWAFREVDDAVLVLKLTHRDCGDAIGAMLEELAKLSPFRCRVVLIDGFLSDDDYLKLAEITDFTVNTSTGEGQCLPLMEYMSMGKPAVAPDHTAMEDYVDADNAFIVASNFECARWPHDPRGVFRTRRYRLNYESLMKAYCESYDVAKNDPERYARMSESAYRKLGEHCSRAVVLQKFKAFLFETTPARLEASLAS